MADEYDIDPRSKFDPAYIEQAAKLARLGLTDEQMAEYFGVHRDTFHEWRKRYADLAEAVRHGKTMADADVADALYRRALGMDGSSPDTAACIFWLKNRQPLLWRDKRDVEHSGSVKSHEQHLADLE